MSAIGTVCGGLAAVVATLLLAAWLLGVRYHACTYRAWDGRRGRWLQWRDRILWQRWSWPR